MEALRIFEFLYFAARSRFFLEMFQPRSRKERRSEKEFSEKAKTLSRAEMLTCQVMRKVAVKSDILLTARGARMSEYLAQASESPDFIPEPNIPFGMVLPRDRQETDRFPGEMEVKIIEGYSMWHKRGDEVVMLPAPSARAAHPAAIDLAPILERFEGRLLVFDAPRASSHAGLPQQMVACMAYLVSGKNPECTRTNCRLCLTSNVVLLSWHQVPTPPGAKEQYDAWYAQITETEVSAFKQLRMEMDASPFGVRGMGCESWMIAQDQRMLQLTSAKHRAWYDTFLPVAQAMAAGVFAPDAPFQTRTLDPSELYREDSGARSAVIQTPLPAATRAEPSGRVRIEVRQRP